MQISRELKKCFKFKLSLNYSLIMSIIVSMKIFNNSHDRAVRLKSLLDSQNTTNIDTVYSVTRLVNHPAVRVYRRLATLAKLFAHITK